MMCTGVAAVWCPTCGDCECEMSPAGDVYFDNDDCPLHGRLSKHADTVELAGIEQQVTQLATDSGVELSDNDRAEVSRFAQYLKERSRKRKEQSDD